MTLNLKPLVRALGNATLVSMPFISVFAFSQSASATTETNTNTALEEVYVTAEKRPQALSEVPIAIQVLDATFIENGANLGLSDLEYAMPSVNFGRGGRRTRGEITIRGVGGFSRNIGSDGRVAVYVDEVPLGRSSAFDSNLLDIEQIEILRGPQGTLFGTNAIAGAINITTAAPSDTKTATVQQTFGNYGLSTFNASAASPLSDDTSMRLQYSHIESDGYIKNIALDSTLQERNTDSFRGKIHHEFNQDVSITVSGDWLDEEADATNGEALADSIGPGGVSLNGYSSAPDFYEVAHDTEEYETRKIWGTAANLDWNLSSGAKVTSISAIRRSVFEDVSEEDFSAIPLADSTFNESFKQKTQELRYISPENDEFNYVVGLFLSDGELTTDRGARLGTSIVSTPGSLFSKSAALFFHSNIKVNENLYLSLGTRAQREEKEIDYTSSNPSSLPGFANGTLVDDDTYSALLPKIGLNYTPENNLFFASISRGSKSGGWNADFVPSLANIEYDQEFATNFEIGHKFADASSPLQSSVTLYSTKYTDFQIFQLLEGLTQLTNAGEATSQGVELEIEYEISPKLALTLGSSYNKAEFDEFENGPPGDDYSGNDLPYAPEMSHFFGVDYDFTIADKTAYWHIDYSFSDDFYTDPNNEESHQVRNYTLVNTNLGIEISELISVKAWVRNLTDNDRLRFRDVTFLGIQRGFALQPRTAGISFELNF